VVGAAGVAEVEEEEEEEKEEEDLGTAFVSGGQSWLLLEFELGSEPAIGEPAIGRRTRVQ
jgi:hypothetical protein